MRLTEKQIAILVRVRESMQIDVEQKTTDVRPYICWNIVFDHLGIRTMPAMKLFDELLTESSQEVIDLVDGICASMDGGYSFESWLDQKYNLNHDTLQGEQAAVMGRLAWVDRMIETGEVN